MTFQESQILVVNFEARHMCPEYSRSTSQGKLGSLKLGSKLSCMGTTQGRQKSNPKLIGYVYLETWKLGNLETWIEVVLYGHRLNQ
jgi:hypothetical protein